MASCSGVENEAYEQTESNDTESNEKKETTVIEKESEARGFDRKRGSFKNKSLNTSVPDLVYKLKGPLFLSVREKKCSSWNRKPLEIVQKTNDDEIVREDLTRSQYSLVSSAELTAGALQLWRGLPDEIRYDSSLALFKQNYEKEHGSCSRRENNSVDGTDQIPLTARSNGSLPTRRLPTVASAPHLNNNVHGILKDEIAILNGSKCQINEEKKLKTIDEKLPHNGNTTLKQASHMFKIGLLIISWIFFTTLFLLYSEKHSVTRHSSVAAGDIKSYVLNISQYKLSVFLNLKGPFVAEQYEKKLNSREKAERGVMRIWLEKWYFLNDKGPWPRDPDLVKRSAPWEIILEPDDDVDFTEGENRLTVLNWTPDKLYNNTHNKSVYAISMNTTSNVTTPFTLQYSVDPINLTTGVIYSCILLCALYVLIIFELVNRTMAAVLVSTAALAILALVGERPSLEELVSWLDVETLLLLFSMMLLVSIMAETGVFDFLAVFTFEATKGRIWPLIMLLSAITAIVSTVLDNVTTVLLMTPVTIRLCEVMDLDPIPVLMSMVLYSNIGGTVTPVGDPPNVIIASNKAVIQAGVNFTNFTLHMVFGILLVSIQTYFQLRYIYRDTNKLRTSEPREILDIRQQIAIWRRAADSLPPLSRDEMVVKDRLEKKVRKLTVRLDQMVLEAKRRACPKEGFDSMLKDMKAKYKIRDKILLIKCSIAVSFVVVMFFLHCMPEFNRVSLGWTALLGALLLLILADRSDLEPILHRVEWSTLLFFAALFVLMEALSKLGLIKYIGGLTEGIILQVEESGRLAVAILLMLWVSGITSAFVDNIPLTTMMVRVVTSLGNNPTLNLPMMPLIWSLSFGACLGGNGTLIGASANVVCAGVAEQHGYRFTFMQFFKIGFPIMLGHLIVASSYLLMCHCVFQWH